MKETNLNKNYINYSITVHSGKMEGVPSVSTSRNMNPNCEKNRKIPGSVCEQCYMDAYEYRRTLMLKLERNTKFYSEIELLPEDIPFLNYGFFRLEAFGDLINALQFKNYALIAECNPHCTFALWTKNPWIIKESMEKYGIEKPENMIIIVSSLMIGKPYNIDRLRKVYPFVDKVFTVYDKETVEKEGIDINCGARHCMTCRKCYTKNEIEYIRELLK